MGSKSMSSLMLSRAEPKYCSTCSKTLLMRYNIKICSSCTPMHFSEILVFQKYTPAECHCCRTNQVNLVHVWASCCLTCHTANKKNANLNDVSGQTRFLQLFDPSPLSEDFQGDVSILVGDEEVIQSHRFILGSKSPVFKRMLDVDMKEKLTGKICIKDIPAPVVRAAIKCMYTGAIEFTHEVTAEEVLSFAHRFEVSWMKYLCEMDLLKSISPSSLPRLLSISYLYELDILKAAAKEQFSTTPPNVQSQLLDALYSFAPLHNKPL